MDSVRMLPGKLIIYPVGKKVNHNLKKIVGAFEKPAGKILKALKYSRVEVGTCMSSICNDDGLKINIQVSTNPPLRGSNNCKN